MKRIYTVIMVLNIIMIPTTGIHAKQSKQASNTNCKKSSNKYVQQEFTTENGGLGIYQPKLRKARIGDDSYIKVKDFLLCKTSKTIRKPKGSIYLGELIDGDNRFALYGTQENPAPINDGPDADVRTENRLKEDFLNDLGSGKYTPDDKWD